MARRHATKGCLARPMLVQGAGDHSLPVPVSPVMTPGRCAHKAVYCCYDFAHLGRSATMPPRVVVLEASGGAATPRERGASSASAQAVL